MYAAQRRHPAASRREKTLNPKPNTNHSLARDPKVRARRVASRATARASRVAFEKNLANNIFRKVWPRNDIRVAQEHFFKKGAADEPLRGCLTIKP